MPSAKPAYDPDESWKHRQFDSAQWEASGERLRSNLRRYYPDKAAVDCPTFGHPADEWVNCLRSEAWSAISIMCGLGLRLTNEQLLVERKDLLATLQKAVRVLNNVSPDLDRLFGVDADLGGTRNKIRELIPFVEASETRVAALPRARQQKEVQNAAAVEVAIRVLRIFKDHGGRISATADIDLNYVSDAVTILKILGDEFGLRFSAATWRKIVAAARLQADDLKQVRTAP